MPTPPPAHLASLTFRTAAPRGRPGLRRALAVGGSAWLLGLAMGLAAPSAHAQAMVLNFDAIPCTTSAIPNGAGGLNWANMFCADGPTTGGGYATGTVSSPNIAFNAGGNPATVTRSGGGVFSLSSAQLTTAFTPAPQVRVEGFVGATSVAVLTFSPTNTGPTLVDLSAITNVDRVVFTSLPTGQLRQFVLDDLNSILGPAHTITATAAPAAGGSVSCTPRPVPDGASTTCPAVPAAGYTVASFTGCTRVGATDTCTLTNVTAPATVSAVFALAPVTVPTLSQGAMALLGLLAAALGLRRLRR